MIVHMTMEITLNLPDGSASIDGTGGRGWVLPDGERVKVWAVPELNDEDDLSFGEALAMGVMIESMVASAEIVEEQEA